MSCAANMFVHRRLAVPNTQSACGTCIHAVEHLTITQWVGSIVEDPDRIPVRVESPAARPDSSPCQRSRYGWNSATPQDTGASFPAYCLRPALRQKLRSLESRTILV